MFASPVQKAQNRISTVPAPVGGLNARDSLAAMPATDAIALENYWPQPYGVAVRLGWQEWGVIPSGGEVGTIATWSGVAGQQALYAWEGEFMYDVSARGIVGAPVLSGLSSAYWQLAGMSNAAGGHLIAVNGVDDGILKNDTGVHRLVAGDGTTDYTWSGLDPAAAIQLTVHQHRLWVTKENSSVGYYLPPDALWGVFKSFDFGPLFQRAGYLAFMATWTIDDGNGAEDHLVAVSSTGYAAVYAGIDPDSADTWSLVGVYYIGSPVKGRRAYAKVGGDLFILTQQGVVSMSGMLTSTKVNEQKNSFPSAKIQYLLSSLIGQYGDLSNWQLQYSPKENMLICNVPTTVAESNIQLAANQITNAWTVFSGMDATTWNIYSDHPFFGTYDGRVCIAWTGTQDGVILDGTGGTDIIALAQQAYSYLDSPGTQKQVGMYRPNFMVERLLSFNSTISYDFVRPELPVPGSLVDPDFSGIWNVGRWDAAKWAGATGPQRQWVQAQGLGVAASISVITSSAGEVLWVSTDYSYKTGGLL
jgi:hypothetical protein